MARMLRWMVLMASGFLALVGGAPLGTGLGASQSGGPQVKAWLSNGVVKLGGAVELFVEVEGAREAKITGLPQADGLKVEPPGAPSREQFTQISGGRMVSRTTIKWRLVIRPQTTGDFTVPAVRLTVDGREVLAGERGMALKVVKDLAGEELGFFEIIDPPRRVYEGEPFTIDLRFGWDAGLAVTALQLFLPWWGELPGTLEVEEGPRSPAATWHNFAVNRRYKVAVEELPYEERDGRDVRPFRLRRRYIATRSGDLGLPGSTLEFSQLIERARGFGGRDRVEDFYVHLPSLTLSVLPIPEEGRPFEWTGAVGALVASRRVDRRDVDVGDSIKLTVSWMGEGNLEFFEPPDLSREAAFSDFRVLGSEDVYRTDERRVVYDLVPISPEVTEIPPVPLWTFNSSTERYELVETDPVPIRVRALESAHGLDDLESGFGGTVDVRDVHTEPVTEAGPPRPGVALTTSSLFAVPLFWGLARIFVRRRGAPDAPVERRRRAAYRNLKRALSRAKSASDQARAVHVFLAARTREPEQAWVGRSPADWSGPQGTLSEAGGRRLTELLAELDERAYAGDDAPAERGPLLTTARSLIAGGL